MKNRKIGILVTMAALALLGLMGCGSGPVVDQFPERFLDRPYTLPKGMASWQVSGGATVAQPAQFNSPNNYQLGVQWLQSLSDDLNLIWGPLPLGIRYQAIKNSEETVGVSWALDLSNSYGQFVVSPTFNSFYLKQLKQDLALDTRLKYYWDFPLGQDNSSWSAQVTTGPAFQLSDKWVVSPRIGASFMNLILKKLLANDPNQQYPAPTLSFPIGVRGQLAGGHLWEVSLDYTLNGLSFNPPVFLSDQINISYTQYW